MFKYVIDINVGGEADIEEGFEVKRDLLLLIICWHVVDVIQIVIDIVSLVEPDLS